MIYKASIQSRFYAGDKLPEGATAGHVHEFNDTYTVSPDWYDDDGARAFIRHDLKLVAGGGYKPIPSMNIISLVITRES